MKIRALIIPALCLTLFSCARGPKDGDYTLTVLSTNDVHGSWFDSTYVGGRIKNSLCSVNTYVDSVRKADGKDNVLLIDAGDCLQGDNAAYYYNYIDTLSPHLFPRLLHYMDYDAVVWGNHDVETGHSRTQRQRKTLLPSLYNSKEGWSQGCRAWLSERQHQRLAGRGALERNAL